MKIQNGFYRHFKGGIYQVFGITKNIDTETWLVIYGKTRPEFARSQEVFFSEVDVSGKLIPRYEYIGNSPIK